MLEKLAQEPQKIPNPSRDEIMAMTISSLKEIDIDCEKAFKSLFLTNALSGEEDYLMSEKLYEMVGPSIISFRDKLLQKDCPKSFDDLLKSITPPRGIRRKNFEG